MLAVKAAPIVISLIAAGGIASLSLFDIPELQAQPASRSLPSIRFLFSRGSHIFPAASVLSTAGFAFLAYSALPPQLQALSQLFRLSANGTIVTGYLAAAALAMSIAPWTSIVMVPTNFRLIEMNEQKGGERSAASARAGDPNRKRGTALDSVNGEGQAPQFTDLSGPQTKTKSDTTETEDKEAQELLGKFGQMNMVRAVLIGAGGIVGLLTALAS